MISIKIKSSGICTHIHAELYRDCGLWYGPNQESPLYGETYIEGKHSEMEKKRQLFTKGN